MADSPEPDQNKPQDPTPQPASNSDQDFIKRAQSKYGSIGAIVASGMLGLDRVLGRKPKDEGAVIWEASGEPGDIDRDGISVDIDESTSVVAHPPRGRAGRHVRKRRNPAE